MTNFERDYLTLLNKYKNNEWCSMKQRNDWRIELEVMEELDEKLKKNRIRQRLYEKYCDEIN